MSEAIKKPIVIKIRGERTFELKFAPDEVMQIFSEYFLKHYHSAEIDGMSLNFDYDNNAGIIVSGHKDIKE
jgi:hypothetical protein